jgi:hypothetical protein
MARAADEDRDREHSETRRLYRGRAFEETEGISQMNIKEYKIEHAYWYDERLALLGFFDTPPAWAHNMAVLEADAHVAALKREEHSELGNRLLDFRDTL